MSKATATLQEAQKNLPALLEMVERGTEVSLTDGAKTLARLTPHFEPTFSQAVQSLKNLEPLPEGFWCS